MPARFATAADADEIVRLAGLMFASMGRDLSDDRWANEGRRQVRERLGTDLAVFVVEHPSAPLGLVAAAAGTIAQRLPTPMNPTGRAAYVQWVCTDTDHRGAGFGREVMVALLKWFDDNGIKTVELHATPMAESLYLSMGFSDIGPRALRRNDW